MKKFADFLRDDGGSYTIEFCLWIPVFLVFLAATVDASLLYLTHNNMWNAARDAARRASVGAFGTGEGVDAEIREYLEGTLLLGGNRYYLPPGQGWGKPEDGEVTVTIQTTVADASLFNIFGAVGWWFGAYSPGETKHACAVSSDRPAGGSIMDCALHAQVTMRIEPALI